MSPTLKRALSWAGHLLAVAGVAFVGIRLFAQAGEIPVTRMDGRAWVVLAILSAVYGVSSLLLAFAWRDLLRQSGTQISGREAVRIYGVSQISRYVPGNIFHLAGRQAMGIAAGLPGRELAKSMLWELVLIALAGALFVFLLAPRAFPGVPGWSAILLFAVGVLAAAIATTRVMGGFDARALLMQIGFLLISGLLFVVLLYVAVHPGDEIAASVIPLVCGAYVISWLAGLVTPGAPAGLGVRELVLLFLLHGVIAEPYLLLAVVLGRVVTVVGDVLLWLFAFALSGNSRAG